MTANSLKCAVFASGLAPTSSSRQWPGQVRQHRGERRPVDALDRADDHLGGRPSRRRCGPPRRGPRPARRARSWPRCGSRSCASCGSAAVRGVVHRHDLGGVHDLDLGAGGTRPRRAAARARRARPTRRVEIPNSRAAATAPSTLTAGAWSPPIASTAIRTSALSRRDGKPRVRGIIATRGARSSPRASTPRPTC